VSGDVFDLVQAKLSDPRRISNRQGTDRKHLGSGLFRCAECGAPVSGWSQNRYRCRDRHVNRARPAVDDLVRNVIALRLQQPDAANLLQPAEDDLAPLLEESKRLRERLAAINADYDAGLIDGQRYAAATERVRSEQRIIERRLAASSSPSSAVAEMLNAPDPGEAFLNASLMAQRGVIDALCEVYLLKGTKYSRTFDPETVRIVWRGAEG
jgi:site-specific DNA recombinase